MYYKMFIFGSKELFALIELMGPPAKADNVIIYNGIKYKILMAVYTARDIKFDETGKRKFNPGNEETKTSLLNSDLCEIYVTEIPNF